MIIPMFYLSVRGTGHQSGFHFNPLRAHAAKHFQPITAALLNYSYKQAGCEAVIRIIINLRAVDLAGELRDTDRGAPNHLPPIQAPRHPYTRGCMARCINCLLIFISFQYFSKSCLPTNWAIHWMPIILRCIQSEFFYQKTCYIVNSPQ